MVERKITINAPRETVYRVIRDFESYPEFIPSTKSAKEDKKTNDPEVDFSLQVIKPIRYRLRFRCDPPHEIHWELVKGELMKKNEGSWILEELDSKKTKALYRIDVEFGWMVPKMVVEELTRIQLPELLEAFKTRAENLK